MDPADIQIAKWSVERIQGFIDGKVQESVNLDYKGSKALSHGDYEKKELAKDVSAMANSEGGSLIYGVSEKGHFPTEIDGGVDPSKIDREFIENVLNSTIHPRINGLLIHPVPLLSGNHLYVIEIPKAVQGGPHQSADKRYYKRFNFKSEPMEDYEVRDVMRRALGPDLFCTVEIPQYIDDPSSEEHRTFTLSIGLGNKSHEVALYAHVQVLIDSNLEIVGRGDFEVSESDVIYIFGDIPFKVRPMNLAWGVPHKLPIWRGMKFLASRRSIRFRTKTEDDSGKLLVVLLTAPQMEPKSFTYVLLPASKDSTERVQIAIAPS